VGCAGSGDMGRPVWVLVAVGLLAVGLVGLPAFAEGDAPETDGMQVVAAPGVAARLLTQAGIKPGYHWGRVRGSHVADVARVMGPGSGFAGVAAAEVVAYECAVASFLRGKAVAAPVSRWACATVPNPPQDLAVMAGDGQLVVTWPPPVDDDGVCTGACDAPVVGYTVTLEPADAGPLTVGADQLSVVVDGLTNGTVYCWGFGRFGRLGNGATASQTRPVKVATDGGSALPAGVAVTAISVGDFHTCAIASGVASCWGAGFSGQLGNGATASQTRPVAVATDADSPLSALPADTEVTAISAAAAHTCAAADPDAYCWGNGASGQLGNSATANQTRPVKVATGGGSALPADAAVTAISAGGLHTCAVADGVAYCWGNGGAGQLGNGATANQTRPVTVLSPV
jgi:hypothetical protein